MRASIRTIAGFSSSSCRMGARADWRAHRHIARTNGKIVAPMAQHRAAIVSTATPSPWMSTSRLRWKRRFGWIALARRSARLAAISAIKIFRRTAVGHGTLLLFAPCYAAVHDNRTHCRLSSRRFFCIAPRTRSLVLPAREMLGRSGGRARTRPRWDFIENANRLLSHGCISGLPSSAEIHSNSLRPI